MRIHVWVMILALNVLLGVGCLNSYVQVVTNPRYTSPLLSFSYPRFMVLDEQRGSGQPNLKFPGLEVVARSAAEQTTQNAVFQKIMINIASAAGWAWHERHPMRIGNQPEN